VGIENLKVPYRSSHVGCLVLKSLALVFLLSTLAVAGTVGFTGDYAPSNWTFANDAFGNSHVDWSGAPASFTVYRNNAFTSPLLPSLTELTAIAPYAETISFEYSFGTGDPSAASNHNQFGLVENGVLVTLFDSVTDGSGTNPFYLSSSFQVTAGESFGFYISTDANDGAGGQSATIQDFVAATPEPASFALLAAGLGILLLGRRGDKAAR